MSSQDAVARFPLAPLRVGFVVGAIVFGLVALVVTLAVSDTPLATLRSAILFALFFGFFAWLLSRGHQERQRATLIRVPQHGRRDDRGALLRGLLVAVVLAAIETLLLGGLAWLWGLDASGLPGILFGSALWGALGLRDLRSWQDRNGLLVFTRAGVRQFALTSRQVGQQLVAVAKDRGPVDDAQLSA